MIKKIKKGFTLVELVVVIAIIAILSGVSVAVYIGITNKAKLSNDQTMISQMNTTLACYNALDKFKYAGDSIVALNQNGFVGKYTPYSSGYHYAYHKESNKMYLIDASNTVVFPKNDVAVGDLWILWQNTAVDKVVGASKYISLVNISNSGYYATHFATGEYTLDLAGHYIAYTAGTLSNVKVVNGILVGGAQKKEDSRVTELGKIEKSEITSGADAEHLTEIKDKVYDCTNKAALQGMKNIKFVNCYFYNCDDQGTIPNNRYFENCTFVDSVKYCFNLQGDGVYTGTLSVKGCTFLNCARIFNLPVFIEGHQSNVTINIEGNTIYGVTAKDRPAVQFCFQQENETETARQYSNITFSKNYFVECATTQAGLFTIHEDTVVLSDISADSITFSENKVDSSISAEKYVVNDDGKPNSAFAGYAAEAFKTSLINKFTASIVR